MSETGKPLVEMRSVQVTALSDVSRVVLEDVSWSVHPGDFWVVAGPQHSGKSDLLMHAAGLTTPLAGNCCVFGWDTREFDETRISERLKIGFAFSGGKLFSQITIAENVALPLRYHRELPDEETAKFVEELLELLGMQQFAGVTPANIPPVWRQRAALARALVLKPELLLLDNPNGGLISRHRQWLVEFLEHLWRGHPFFGGRPITIVVTTDDLPLWRHPKRKFAAVHEGKFSVLGGWGGDAFKHHQAINDLLFGANESEEEKAQQSEAAAAIETSGRSGTQQ